jgi:hypothetical protein
MNPKKDEGLLLRDIILLWANSFQCSGVTRIRSEAEFRLAGRAGMTKAVTFQKEWKAVTFRRCTNMHLRCTAVLGLVRAGFSVWFDSSTAKLGEMLRMRDECEMRTSHPDMLAWRWRCRRAG